MRNTNQLRTFTRRYNQSSYIHLIPNVGSRTSIELHPDEDGECVWFVFACYPRRDGSVQAFSVTRDGSAGVISGSAPTVAKYPTGSSYTTGYIRLTFDTEFKHVVVIGTALSVITGVN